MEIEYYDAESLRHQIADWLNKESEKAFLKGTHETALNKAYFKGLGHKFRAMASELRHAELFEVDPPNDLPDDLPDDDSVPAAPADAHPVE